MKMKRWIVVICCLALLFGSIPELPGEINGCGAAAKTFYRISNEERDKFFKKSAILGNSVGLGLKYYFATKEDGYLGNPHMLVWGSYSFINDFTNYEKFMIHYQGKPMKARDAVQACGAKHVFINMGTNDFNTSQSQIYAHYLRYIKEIKTTNPDVDIFILATTPTRIGKGLLNNREINKLNNQMQELAEKRSDLYYIDINTPMKDAEGRLKKEYTSDGFVHLTMTAYQTWTKTMVRFVRQLLKKQKKAKKLVKQAEKTLKRNHYEKAAEAVRELDRSSLKKDLKKQLKDILKAIREAEAAAVTPTPTAAPTATGSTLTPTVSPTGTDPSWIPTPIPAVTGTVLKKHTGNTVTVTGPATELTELEQEKAAYFRTHSIKKLKCKKTVEKKVRLTWKKQFGADYYTVYRSENKADNYREIGTTKKHKFKDERAKKRKTYFYRIQSHMTIRESSFTSKKSKAAKVYVQPEKPVTVIAGECFVVDMVNLNSVYNGNHHFVAKIGVNTYTMMHNNYFEYQGQTITGIERIAYYKPDRVYYLIGANESAWATPSWTMDNYKTMRSLLKKINSHVEIILVQIPPFGYSSSQNIPSVSSRNAFNDSYQKMADKYKDVYYCPATDVLDDGTSHLMKQYDAGDGCHWNTNGTIAVSKEIKKWSKNTFHNW